MKLKQLQEAKYDVPPLFKVGQFVVTPYASSGTFKILKVYRADDIYWYTLRNRRTGETYDEPEHELDHPEDWQDKVAPGHFPGAWSPD